MASRNCPYCGIEYLVTDQLKKFNYFEFDNSHHETIYVHQHLCPRCDKIAYTISSSGFDPGVHYSYPSTSAMFLPDYIPQALRQDYLEAVNIADLSPKASATLARRCLQGMIHDFWKIKEKNLNAEITALKGRIPPNQWQAIDAVRKIGNIGAHMEKDVELIIDVDPDEAKKLLMVIELLFKNWYIADYEDKRLYAEVTKMAQDKETERHSGADNADGK